MKLKRIIIIMIATMAVMVAASLVLAGCGISPEGSGGGRSSVSNWTIEASAGSGESGTPSSSSPQGVRIAVISDVHVQKKRPEEEDYALDMLDALLWELKREEAELLILCGDNTNGGDEYQHGALVQKLKSFEDQGIPVLAVPGNHDINTFHQADFAKFYAKYGYKEAYSRDTGSLSYSYLMGNTMFIMLENGGYGFTENPGISDVLLSWVQRQLEDAKREGYQVVTVGHFPILIDHRMDVEGKEKLIALLKRYEVPIYLSGHLHNRNVTVDEGLVELVLEKYTSNPSCYGMITVGDDGAIGYEPKTVDISLWARETGRTDEQSLLFSEIEQEAWRQNSEETVEILSEGYDLTAEEKADAVAFFDEILLNLSRGSVYRERGALATHPGYEPFWKIAEHSNYGPWIKSLFENSNPYTEGFVIRR